MYISSRPTYGTFHTLVYIVNKMSRHVSLTLTATYDKVYHVKVHLAQKFLDYYPANQVRKILFIKFSYSFSTYLEKSETLKKRNVRNKSDVK